MLRRTIGLASVIMAILLAHSARADLLGYWSADSTGGAGTILPNDQGNSDLDGEIVGDAQYTAPGEGHTGQAGDYAIEFPGENDDYATLPPTDVFLEEATVTAWVNGIQTGNWAGLVLSRAQGQPIGLDIHAFDGEVNYIWNNDSSMTWDFRSGLVIPEEEWAFVALTITLEEATLYLGADGTLDSAVNDIPHEPQENFHEWRLAEDDCCGTERNFAGLIDDVSIWDEALSEEQLNSLFQGTANPLSLAGLGPGPGGAPVLLPGDANMDLEFNQLDLVQVQIAAKYLSGQPATWGEGDWDGAPGGQQGSPPAGDGQFNQLDIIAALNGGAYLTGPYAVIRSGGQQGDGQTSVVYDPGTGEVSVDTPAGVELTSINIDSAGGIFTGQPAQNLGGSFDNDADANIFKATFGGSFGSLTFGNVAQPGLAQDFVLSDLTVVGSLQGGGALGDVDLIYVPEPESLWLSVLGLAALARRRRLVVTACHAVTRATQKEIEAKGKHR